MVLFRHCGSTAIQKPETKGAVYNFLCPVHMLTKAEYSY